MNECMNKWMISLIWNEDSFDAVGVWKKDMD